MRQNKQTYWIFTIRKQSPATYPQGNRNTPHTLPGQIVQHNSLLHNCSGTSESVLVHLSDSRFPCLFIWEEWGAGNGKLFPSTPLAPVVWQSNLSKISFCVSNLALWIYFPSYSQECRLRAFKNMILRRIFRTKKDENGECRRLQNEELYSLYRSPNIVRVIKSRRLRWSGHVSWSKIEVLSKF